MTSDKMPSRLSADDSAHGPMPSSATARSAFVKLVAVKDKPRALLDVAAGSYAFRVDVAPESFRNVPSSPFCYWAGASTLQVFASCERFESEGRATRQGLATSDDFRFARCWYEVSAPRDEWPSLAKGGAFSRFYRDVMAVVKWQRQGAEMKAFAESRPGVDHWSKRITNTDWYRRPGVTWPLRGSVFSAQAVPEGCLFSIAGKMAFAPEEQRQATLAIMNSSAFNALMMLFAGKVGGVQYESGLIQRTPMPALAEQQTRALSAAARRGWAALWRLDTASEVSHAFGLPALAQVDGASITARIDQWTTLIAETSSLIAAVQAEIDDLCFGLYGISTEDRQAITHGFGSVSEADDHPRSTDQAEDDDADEAAVELDPVGLAAGLVSWAAGVAVGRFDIRLVTGERQWPSEPDPFDPLPVCSPAMLTGGEGLPLQVPPTGYPLSVSSVLVDDTGHELDLGARVRAVFDVVFGDDADRWWTEVGASMDPRTRDIEAWLRKGFFDYHLKTYSKSRRKAPKPQQLRNDAPFSGGPANATLG